MSEYKKSERIATIVKILSDNPNKLFHLSYFMDMLRSANSTISEDIDTINTVFKEMGLGEIITEAGAAGGLRYLPIESKQKYIKFVDELCINLSKMKELYLAVFYIQPTCFIRQIYVL
jgi:purine operon repressor